MDEMTKMFMMSDVIFLVFGASVALFVIIYMYINIVKLTKPVKGKRIKIERKNASIIPFYVPIVEYTVDDKVYQTDNAFNTSLLINAYKVGKVYDIRYKIKNPEKARYYNISAFMLIIVMCLLQVLCACISYVGFAKLL